MLIFPSFLSPIISYFYQNFYNMQTLGDLTRFLGTLAPWNYQESYDNSGCLVGESSTEIRGVLIALDCTEAVIDEAISKGCNVVLTHHPIIFKGLKRLNGSNYVERTVLKAIKNDVCLVAIHTNLDAVKWGVNAVIAQRLGITNFQILSAKHDALFQVGVFVPNDFAEQVKSAMTQAGAGKIGNYDSCSFSVEGQGQFRPIEGSNPVIGSLNTLEKVAEQRITMVVSSGSLNHVISAMKNVHPYETVAYDVVQLQQTNEDVGSGMIGELDEPITLSELLTLVKERFHCGGIRFTGSKNKTVQRIAWCGGSGSFLIHAVQRAKADVYITGDVKYHEFFDAEHGLDIMDIGHFESEQFTSHFLMDQLKQYQEDFPLLLADTNTNPVNYFF